MRRKHRHLSLVLAVLVGLTIDAAGHDASKSAIRHGNRLMERGRFADAAATYTRAIEQHPNDAKVYYYRALANEMVDRHAAIRDWYRFIELAPAGLPSPVFASQAQQRVQALEKISSLPDPLQPSRYIPRAGDYYQLIADTSAERVWTAFQNALPIKVFANKPPENWRRALWESVDEWMAVFPLQAVNAPERADIVLSWSKLSNGRMGTEEDKIESRDEGDRAVRKKTSFVILDVSRRWSEPEMKSVVLHELGHALGIAGHSDNPRDVMFPQEVSGAAITVSGAEPGIVPLAGSETGSATGPSAARTSVGINTRLTPRDVNTLIRLYNCPAPLVHLEIIG